IPLREAASYLGIAAITLKRLYGTGKGPPVIRLGRRVIFDTADLDAYLNEHKGVAPKNGEETGAAADRGARAGPPAKTKPRTKKRRFAEVKKE
ncbi:MAG: helix-turn-helix domain-containing protein, partial [Pseudomonadota bacterium]|nr:helix-turn-helix domain-containing protein [Pseudomonadota bacterium]